jgi:hypothetical protein
MTPAPPQEPKLELIETCWRLRAPSRRILECAIYRTQTGPEVRAGYEPDDLLHSKLMIGLETARAYAAELRDAVRVKGGFEELPINVDANAT